MSKRLVFVPSLFTVLNLFSGFLSILNSVNGRYIEASWFIIFSAIFDFLDGVMARLTKSASEFGVEFDSLADVVSFGVAPSVLVYQFYFRNFGPAGIFVSSLLLIFGALRLARFNVELIGFDKKFFKGLPIPSSASTVASYIILFYNPETGMPQFAKQMLVPMVFILSALMISTIKYETAPKFSVSGFRNSPFKFIYVYGGFTAAILTKGKLLFPWFAFFIIAGALKSAVNTFKLAFAGPSANDEDEKFDEF